MGGTSLARGGGRPQADTDQKEANQAVGEPPPPPAEKGPPPPRPPPPGRSAAPRWRAARAETPPSLESAPLPRLPPSPTRRSQSTSPSSTEDTALRGGAWRGVGGGDL